MRLKHRHRSQDLYGWLIRGYFEPCIKGKEYRVYIHARWIKKWGFHFVFPCLCLPFLLHQGHFSILSLSGAFTLTKAGRKKGRLIVALSDDDASVFGGLVAGSIIAAVPTQVSLTSVCMTGIAKNCHVLCSMHCTIPSKCLSISSCMVFMLCLNRLFINRIFLKQGNHKTQ